MTDLEKHPVGRPTKYKPEFNEEVIRLMREGASIIEIAYELNVARSTIYEWKETYGEFSDTLKRGSDFAEGWWMKEGRLNIHNVKFNSPLWYMNMKNRFGWMDKQEVVQNNDENVKEVQERVEKINKEKEKEF